MTFTDSTIIIEEKNRAEYRDFHKKFISTIFGNRFIYDQRRLTVLSEKMQRSLTLEQVEEFFIDVFAYYSNRGRYNIPSVQHLPNTHITRDCIKFFAEYLISYPNTIINYHNSKRRTARETWKTYLSERFEFKYDSETGKCRPKTDSLGYFLFQIPSSNRGLFDDDPPYTEEDTPYLERAHAILSAIPEVVYALRTWKYVYEGDDWLGEYSKPDLSNNLVQKPFFSKTEIERDITLRNDFVTEPHSQTKIKKFITYMYQYRGISGKEKAIYQYDHYSDPECNKWFWDHYKEMIYSMSYGQFGLSTIVNVICHYLFPFRFENGDSRHADTDYLIDNPELSRSQFYELLDTTQSEILRKGSLFIAIFGGLLDLESIPGYRDFDNPKLRNVN